jgi:hypothetical protein
VKAIFGAIGDIGSASFLVVRMTKLYWELAESLSYISILNSERMFLFYTMDNGIAEVHGLLH